MFQNDETIFPVDKKAEKKPDFRSLKIWSLQKSPTFLRHFTNNFWPTFLNISASATIRAKPEHHKFLIGRQGANIQTVRDKTGARIIFPSEKDEDREVITILGSKEAVEAAKIELESRIRDLDKIVEETMTVDPKHHRYFVARRGEVLRSIGDEFGGVVISFPRLGVTSDKVQKGIFLNEFTIE